jgi:hypothetical protein
MRYRAQSIALSDCTWRGIGITVNARRESIATRTARADLEDREGADGHGGQRVERRLIDGVASRKTKAGRDGVRQMARSRRSP